MKAQAVWISGVAVLALVGGLGLGYTLPRVEQDLRSHVEKTLSDKGLSDVKADVSGQSVTLSLKAPSAQGETHLTAAAQAVAAIRPVGQPELQGGSWLTGPVTEVHIGRLASQAAVQMTASAAHGALVMADAATSAPATQTIPAVGGEKATAIASASDGPPVAGEEAKNASTLAPTSAAAQACEDQLQHVVGARKVTYVFGTYDLTPESQPLLDDIYKTVAACPAQTRVTVAGYTDNVGDATANLLISKARAQATADALVARGMAPDRVSVQGFGAASPVADNATPDGRSQNRRVVVLVSGG